VSAIFDDLAWLGCEWPEPVLFQSGNLQRYHAVLEGMRRRGLIYRCFRTRREILDEIARAPHGLPEGPDGPIYLGPVKTPDNGDEDRRVAAGEAFAWRLSMARAIEALGPEAQSLSFTEEGAGPNGETGVIAVDPWKFGDVVLARRDLGVSYHLAVTVDDADQGVTHVIRGHDLHPSAHLHRLLQALLGLPVPVWRHHGLLVGADGRKLSKRDGARSLASLRAEGVSPLAIRRQLGF
jgi:glutamyl-Q tRNA(Asp) synthetase